VSSISHADISAGLMVFKLVMIAAKTWRRLKGENQCRRSSAVSGSATASRPPRRQRRPPPDQAVTQ
jgi:hypothetical protein